MKANYNRKNTPPRRPTPKHPFDPAGYTDAETLVIAYLEYSMGMNGSEMLELLDKSATPEVESLMKQSTTEKDIDKHLTTNGDFLKTMLIASAWSMANDVIKILTDDSPEEWNILNIGTLKYVRSMTVLHASTQKKEIPLDRLRTTVLNDFEDEGYRSFAERVMKIESNSESEVYRKFMDNFDQVVDYFHNFKDFK